MLLPYVIKLQSLKENIFFTTICAESPEQARQLVAKQFNAEVLDVTAQKLCKYCLIEHDKQFNHESVIYSSDDLQQVEIMKDHLNRVWQIRYSYYIN